MTHHQAAIVLRVTPRPTVRLGQNSPARLSTQDQPVGGQQNGGPFTDRLSNSLADVATTLADLGGQQVGYLPGIRG